MSVDVVLVRHGDTAWTDTGRVQGWAPIPLSERGLEQARTTASHIRSEYDVSAVVSSDLKRATQTGAVVADACGGVGLRTNPAWRERDFGVYQGLADDRFFSLIEEDSLDFDEPPESGESWQHVADRVTDGWDDLVDSRDEGVTVVVSHFGPICLLLGSLEGTPAGERLNRSVPPCSIHELDVDETGGATVCGFVTDL